MGRNGASRSSHGCKTQSATTAAERVPPSPADRPIFQPFIEALHRLLPSPPELPGWGNVELPDCTPSASCTHLELKQAPPSRIKPLSPRPTVCWVCWCRGGTACPARVLGQEIRTSAHFDKVRGGKQPEAEKTLHTGTQRGSTHQRGPIMTIHLDLKRHEDADISEESSVLLQ